MVKKISLCLISLTLISGIILASSYASADVIDDVSITIDTSCTITGTGNNTHNATINGGTYVENIGTTTLKVFCNDAGGFSIYAIGFTGDAYTGADHTKLIGASTDLKISTGTATGSNSSDPSNWAMKLTKLTGSGVYHPENLTITNGYSNYSVVPDTFTKVATYSAVTDKTLGAKLDTTYAAYMASAQPADIYSGKVKYTLVYPSTETPLQPQPCTADKICYYPNSGDVADTMGDQDISSSNVSALLWPSNYIRQNYGFAGWSTTFDYSDPDGFLGPGEQLYNGSHIPFSQAKANGLSLYAYWVKSAGSLQGWTGCGAMSIGDITALTDQRDNNTYAVAKLADGKCWMIENLRLDYDAAHNTDGLLAQGYGGAFAGLAESESSLPNSATANTLYYSGTQSGTATINVGSTAGAYRIPRYNNSNTADNTDNMTGRGDNVYSYGNYYNWSAAAANTGDILGATVDTSICPDGWRLPTGGGDGDFGLLSNSLGGVNENGVAKQMGPETNPTATTMYYRFLKFPNNIILAGSMRDSTISYKTSQVDYWTSTASTSSYDSYFSLRFHSDIATIYPGIGGLRRDIGLNVRCVVNS